jgi:hypothetical protein
MKRFALIFPVMAGCVQLVAQVPDAAPPAQSPPPPANTSAGRSKAGTAAAGQGSFLGKDIPLFSPGTEIITWDGRNWQISNNRLFEARFEKYLNAPEETTDADRQYQAIIRSILDKLAPGAATTASIDEAFRLLPRGSAFDVDARLCDGIADAVYSAWRAQDASQRLAAANAALEQERKTNEWNARLAAGGLQLDQPPQNKEMAQQWAKEQQLKRDLQVQPYTTRLAEVLAAIKANQVKKELSEFQAKVEFQALIVQLFFQRRFQHVLIGTRFYRNVFTTADTELKLGKDSKDLFSKSTGMPPTVGTLDALANEAVRDVREGVRAYEFLLSKNELESATKRLGESFSIGEYMPEIRTLPREKKRPALEFAQKSRQLLSAIEVKDYALAEQIVKELSVTARDFDTSKPMAAIETARTVSAMHLAKARNAAVSGDKAVLETELRQATEIWPRNPALAEISGLIFSQADVQQKALIDLDQLLSQRNYRQIYDDKMRFIAASAMYPERREQLKEVLDQMQIVEGAMIQAHEIAKRGDHAGAWETVETVFQQFPDDTKLNQLRATLTTEAAEFVRSLRTAQQLEAREQFGSSLAWFLKAQRLYPGSEFARDGVSRLVKKVLPELPPAAM